MLIEVTSRISGWSSEDHFSRKSQPWCFPNLPQGMTNGYIYTMHLYINGLLQDWYIRCISNILTFIKMSVLFGIQCCIINCWYIELLDISLWFLSIFLCVDWNISAIPTVAQCLYCVPNKACYVCGLSLQGYRPPDEGPSEYQSIPLNKIEDFGVHCKQ